MPHDIDVRGGNEAQEANPVDEGDFDRDDLTTGALPIVLLSGLDAPQ